MSTKIELVWPNKDKFLLMPRDADGKPVWVDPTHPAAAEVRLARFTGAVGDLPDADEAEDPYADNLLFTGDSLDVLRVLAQVPEFAEHYAGKVKLVYIDPPFNTGQTFDHYDDWLEHSTWLSFMRDRLYLIKDLLAPDGTVWVHLDDVEQHRMRLLLDEVFGAGCFVTEVTWQKKYKAGNSIAIHSVTNPILVYSRTRGWRRSRGLPPLTEQTDKYRNSDGDPRGRWRLTHTGERTYLDDLLAKGAMPTNLWTYDVSGHTETGTKESRALFGSSFDTPKPEVLLQRVIHIASNPGDIVLDCFAGSGTTGAVAHKMGRRWVLAEDKPAVVGKFTRVRLSKVVRGEDGGGVSAAEAWTGGGGFRTLSLAPSMYEVGPGGVALLSAEATSGDFAQAVAGQLGFAFAPDGLLCGRLGRMRLAVVDGAVGQPQLEAVVAALREGEKVTVVARVVLPGAEAWLREVSPGSRLRKAPRDVLGAAVRPRRARVRSTSGSVAPAADAAAGTEEQR